MTKFLDFDSMPLRVLAFAATIIFAALIAYLSLQPTDSLAPFQIWDKIQHFTAYMALSAPLAVCLGRGRLVWAIIIASAYGVLMEFAQGYLPIGRTASGLDALANTLGALAGSWIAMIVTGRRRSGV